MNGFVTRFRDVLSGYHKIGGFIFFCLLFYFVSWVIKNIFITVTSDVIEGLDIKFNSDGIIEYKLSILQNIINY